ncbi:SRPBCC family protein [Echinicola sediminis]
MEKITVKTVVNAPVDTVWAYWTAPEHIVKWNSASEDWHTPRASNDLRKGGSFTSRMEAKDGSMGFDFSGTYREVEKGTLITYVMEDGREVEIVFAPEGEGTLVKETFDPEQSNPVEMQRGGWQAILDNFKKYVEASS